MELGRLPLDAPFSGVELGYVDWGPRDADRVVLCVHGLTRNARDFDALAERLADGGARVVAVDVAGRGRSTRLSNPRDYAVPVYVRHIRRFLEILDIREVDWIGTSMGGLIGMVFATERPRAVRSLILNDVGPLVPATALQQIQTYLGADHLFPSFEELEAHLRFIHAGFGPLSDDQWRHLATHSAREDKDGWRLSYDPAIRVPYDAIADADIELWPLWDRITSPALVLRGGDSALLLAETADEMTRRGPKASVVEIEGVGHAPALMADDQIAAVEDWLRSISAARGTR